MGACGSKPKSKDAKKAKQFNAQEKGKAALKAEMSQPLQAEKQLKAVQINEQKLSSNQKTKLQDALADIEDTGQEAQILQVADIERINVNGQVDIDATSQNARI